MDVAAATGQGGTDLGHEGGHDAMQMGDLLDARFEQHSTVGSSEDVRIENGGLIHARAGFGVEAFYRHIEVFQKVEQIGEELAVLRAAHNGIAEHAGRKWLQVGEAFLLETVRILAEIEPLELLREERLVAHLLGTVANGFEQAARTHLQRSALRITEIGQEERQILLPRHLAIGAEVYAGLRIGIAGVPTRISDIVVGHIATVPTEDHIAEAETTFHCRKELVLAHHFAAQNAVNVCHGHLHLEVRGVADLVQDLFFGEACFFHG